MAQNDLTHTLVEMIFELRYSLSGLALRCKRAGLDVDSVTLSKNDEDFLLRETEDALTARGGSALKGVVAEIAKRRLATVATAGADREGDEEAV